MLVRIGRGVGSGLIIDGRIVGGARHAAGEIGHVVSDTDEGEPCACGNSGCLERWLAIPRIEAHLAEPSADRDAVLTEAGRRLGLVQQLGILQHRFGQFQCNPSSQVQILGQPNSTKTTFSQ